MTIVAPNGNRAARRATRQGRPFSDLLLTRVDSFIFIGLRGSGFVRLTPNQAKRHLVLLAGLVDDAIGLRDDLDSDNQSPGEAL